jgi:hypothetical protein
LVAACVQGTGDEAGESEAGEPAADATGVNRDERAENREDMPRKEQGGDASSQDLSELTQ